MLCPLATNPTNQSIKQLSDQLYSYSVTIIFLMAFLSESLVWDDIYLYIKIWKYSTNIVVICISWMEFNILGPLLQLSVEHYYTSELHLKPQGYCSTNKCM